MSVPPADSSISNDDHDESPTNPYLALREAKIARNEARLRELGLIKQQQQQKQTEPVKKKKSTSTTTSHADNDPPIAVRRSRRITTQQPTYAKEVLSLPDEFQEPELYLASAKRKRNQANPTSSDPSITKRQVVATPPKSNSVRSISLTTETLLFGNKDTTTAGMLGIPLEQTGKDFCIQESFRRAAYPKDRERLQGENESTVRLSFNKYSGVQAWENCVFLWVNLGNPNDDVVNEFRKKDDTTQITWFGGSRMHKETPAIQRLLKRDDTIILWCRHYQKQRKTFGPYVCLGRLAYHSHIPDSSPLSFVWTLMDADRLRKHPDEQVRQSYQEITSS